MTSLFLVKTFETQNSQLHSLTMYESCAYGFENNQHPLPVGQPSAYGVENNQLHSLTMYESCAYGVENNQLHSLTMYESCAYGVENNQLHSLTMSQSCEVLKCQGLQRVQVLKQQNNNNNNNNNRNSFERSKSFSSR